MTENGAKLFNKEPYVIFLMDAVLSVCASAIALMLIRWISVPIPDFYHLVAKWCLMSAISTIVASIVFGTFRVSIEYITIRSSSKIAFMIALKDCLLVASLLLGILPEHTIKLGVLLIVFDFLFTFAFLILVRGLIVFFMQNNRRSMEESAVRHRVMVFGISPKSIAQIPRLNDSSYYDVVGILVTDKSYAGRVINDRKVFCVNSQEEFDFLCAKFGGIESILFARDGDAKDQKDYVINWCITAGINVLVSPRIENFFDEEVPPQVTPQVNMDRILSEASNIKLPDISLGAYVPDGLNAFGRTVKRTADLIASTILLVLFSPLILICHFAIKMEDKGPSIYKQERIGRFGRPFYIYKFRSMKIDAEKDGPALYAGDDDPRLTKVGKFLRTHHLDELPQLFNVFRGDMSFVGYRPERSYYIQQIIEKDPRYMYLYQIRPGVTSYATLRNGYTDSIEKMLRRLDFDLYYLNHRSWWFDIKILWLTFVNIAFGKRF